MEQKFVKRYSLSHQVADRLEEMIESGKYSIGDKIPTEVELMELFNVSRNTVREAIHSLASSGILEVKQGDGTYVKFNNRFNGYMSLEYQQIPADEVKEVRKAFEMMIAQLSAEKRTDEEMKKIEEAFNCRKALNNNVKEDTLADINFHMAIAEACHNKLILDLYKSISVYIENHITKVQEKTDINMKKIDDLHEQLYLAIKNKNIKSASEYAGEILNI